MLKNILRVGCLFLILIVANACRKSKTDEIQAIEPTPPDTFPTQKAAGRYKVSVIRIDIAGGYSYYSYPPDTTLFINEIDARTLSIAANNQTYILPYKELKDGKFSYQLANYSPNYSAFVNFIEGDVDSMYFYCSEMYYPQGLKFIFSGRKQY